MMTLAWRRVAAAGSMILVAGTVAVAAPQVTTTTAAENASTVYLACADKSSGVMHLVVDPSKGCKKTELALQWNVQGPQGPTGPQGPRGPTGPQGPPGLAGDITTSYGPSSWESDEYYITGPAATCTTHSPWGTHGS